MSTIIRRAGEGESRWWLGGGIHLWRLTSAETQGAFMLFEDSLVEGKVTPWHLHPEADETVYVLEGEILIRADEHEQRLGPGGLVSIGRGTPHAFLVTSPAARILCLVAPGNAEAFYREASEPVGAGGTGPIDFARVGLAGQRTGAMTVLGPPPFSR